MLDSIIIAIILLIVGYFFGKHFERKHLKSIIKREHKLNSLPAIASRFPSPDARALRHEQRLVSGSVVVASDYFKTFTSTLISFFGGRVTPYESLIDRARREAILRMKREAWDMHAEYVFNVKYTTTTLQGNKTNSFELLAYGTALIPPTTSHN